MISGPSGRWQHGFFYLDLLNWEDWKEALEEN